MRFSWILCGERWEEGREGGKDQEGVRSSGGVGGRKGKEQEKEENKGGQDFATRNVPAFAADLEAGLVGGVP